MNTVSPLYNQEGRQLLDLVDRLRLLPNVNHDIELPQIVVVGQQSSGKSSVLKAISKIAFPTNSGLCTQFATEIICRRAAVRTTRAQVVPAATIDDDYRRRLDAFSQQWADMAPDQNLSDIIESAKHVMGLNAHQRISRDKLRLEFCGPEQEHISLIDLPGLFEQCLRGQREHDKILVDEMVNEYISGSQTIILAVVSGAYDLQAQRIFSIFEPHQARTLGVITAPDLVESGTARATTFSQLAANSSFKAGHGWHIIRNLSHREEQNEEDRDQVEDQYFADRTHGFDNPWSNVPNSRLGIQNLKAKLATLLQNNIAQGLPRIQQQLRTALRSCKQELDLLGDERVTTEQQRDYLAMKSELLREYTKKELQGGNGTPSLRSSFRTANYAFADRMMKFGATWEFCSDLANLEPRSEPDAPLPITGKAWVDMMLEETSRSRGRELDGLLDPTWVGRMFLRQSCKWRGIAESHMEDAFALVEQYFKEAVEEIAGADGANRFLQHAVQPELERRKNALGAKLTELLTPYSTEYVRTLNRKYRVEEHEIKSMMYNESDKNSLIKNEIIHHVWIMIRYYEQALSVFMDNVESLAIENVLLAGLEDIMTVTKAHKMTEAELVALTSESDEVIERRRILRAKVADYEEGNRMASRFAVRSQYGSRSTDERVNRFNANYTVPTIVSPGVEVASSPAPNPAPAVESTATSSGEETVVPGPSRGRLQRPSARSSTRSSRGSSIASRVFTDGEESQGSASSSVNSTPSKSRS